MTPYFAAPTGDESLTEDDAAKVLEEILEAQNQSRFLGLKLKVPDYIITGIYTQYTDPKDRLYHVLVEFLKQVDPRPTWRAIVDALRNPMVNLPQLAMRVEAAHCPDPTASREVPLSEDSTANGMYGYNYCLRFKIDSVSIPILIDMRSEAISHATNSDTSSTLTSGEMDDQLLRIVYFHLFTVPLSVDLIQ